MINKFYKLKRIKNFIKINHLLFFIKDFNMSKTKYLIEKKYIKNLNLIKYKVINSFLLKLFYNSIKKVILKLFLQYSGIGLLKIINFKKKIIKTSFLFLCNTLFFNILCVKLNNKIYSLTVIRRSYSFNYYQNKKLIYKFFTIQLKKFSFNSK